MLTTEQLAIRRHGIGGSDIAAVLGVDPYRTKLDVYMEKLGLAPPLEDKPVVGRNPRYWGDLHELSIARAYAQVMDVALKPGETIQHPTISHILATPDFYVLVKVPTDEVRTLQCKSTDLHMKERWGDSGTDEVPTYVAAQCLWELIAIEPLMQIRRSDVGVLIGGNDFRVYTLRWNDDLCAAMREAAAMFWTDHVLKRVPPDITADLEAGARYVEAMWPTSGPNLRTATDEESAVAEELQHARAREKHATAEKERLELILKVAIGDDAGLEGPFGKVTYKSTAGGHIRWEEYVKTIGGSKEAAKLAGFQNPGSRRFLTNFSGEAAT